MDDYIGDVNNPASTYAGAGDLVYTSSFEFELELFPPESDYEEADNTAPYLLPPPRDFFVEVGEPFEYFIGDIYDSEAANQTISVSVNTEKVKKFVRWDDIDHLLIVYEGETDEFDIGFYDIQIEVRDDFDVAVIEGYVECVDRIYPTEEARVEADCQDRQAGVTTYDIVLYIGPKFEAGDIYIAPRATEVLSTYEGQVYDLGGATIEDAYATANDDGSVEVASAIELTKLEVIDFAS